MARRADPLAGTVDTSHVDILDETAVKYWTERFSVSRFALEKAVKAVGNLPSEVEAELARQKA